MQHAMTQLSDCSASVANQLSHMQMLWQITLHVVNCIAAEAVSVWYNLISLNQKLLVLFHRPISIQLMPLFLHELMCCCCCTRHCRKHTASTACTAEGCMGVRKQAASMMTLMER